MPPKQFPLALWLSILPLARGSRRLARFEPCSFSPGWLQLHDGIARRPLRRRTLTNRTRGRGEESRATTREGTASAACDGREAFLFILLDRPIREEGVSPITL